MSRHYISCIINTQPNMVADELDDILTKFTESVSLDTRDIYHFGLERTDDVTYYVTLNASGWLHIDTINEFLSKELPNGVQFQPIVEEDFDTYEPFDSSY